MKLDLDHLTGHEAILIEQLSGKPFGAIAQEIEQGSQSVRTVLAVAYVVHRRANPEVTWESFQARDLDDILADLEDGEDEEPGES